MIPTTQDVIDVGQQLFWACLVLSMPTLLTALVVGVAISLIQTVTSIQEMTLTFVPKLIAVVGVVCLAMPWLIEFMTAYYEECMAMFSSYY
ncbi:MAG: flagellar biosynthetic protein FliQ [Planctomycetes bacterium]|nr:flagellar biosynthetic protein FliQ [Planctomycetota bacterium]